MSTHRKIQRIPKLNGNGVQAPQRPKFTAFLALSELPTEGEERYFMPMTREAYKSAIESGTFKPLVLEVGKN